MKLDRQPEDVVVTLEPTRTEVSGKRDKHARPGVKLPGAPPATTDPPPHKGDTQPVAASNEGKPPGKTAQPDNGATIYKGTRAKIIADDPFK